MEISNRYVLGLDMATHNSGIALVSESGDLIDHINIYGCGDDARARILDIYNKLDLYICNHPGIVVAVLEDILLNKWVPNLNACRDLAILQGSVLACLYKNKIPFEVYTANSWKSLVGILNGPEGRNRQAQKLRAIELVKLKYNVDLDDNQSDAICIALGYLVNYEMIKL